MEVASLMADSHFYMGVVLVCSLWPPKQLEQQSQIAPKGRSGFSKVLLKSGPSMGQPTRCGCLEGLSMCGQRPLWGQSNWPIWLQPKWTIRVLDIRMEFRLCTSNLIEALHSRKHKAGSDLQSAIVLSPQALKGLRQRTSASPTAQWFYLEM